MIRRLGNFEKLIYLANIDNSFNFVVIANLTGHMPSDVIRKALHIIQSVNISLNVGIEFHQNDYYFMHNNYTIPIRSLPRLFDLQWIDEVKVELNTSFEGSQAPLIRVLHLYSENKHEILVTFHHVIADGLSGIHFLHRLLSIADSIMENQTNIPLDSQRFLPPIEALLDSNKMQTGINSNNLTSKFTKSKSSYVSSAVSTAIIPFQLSCEDTDKIINVAKVHQVSVHSLICSAMSLAFFENKLFNLPRITCISPVNMRPYLNIPVLDSEMGYLLSRIDIQLLCQPSISVIDNARIIHDKINELIDINAHVELINYIQSMTHRYSQNDLQQRMQFNLPCIFVSNAGKINLDCKFLNFSVNNLHFSLACQGMIGNKDSMGATVVTINSHMSINFHYVEPWITPHEAEKFCNLVVNKLVTL